MPLRPRARRGRAACFRTMSSSTETPRSLKRSFHPGEVHFSRAPVARSVNGALAPFGAARAPREPRASVRATHHGGVDQRAGDPPRPSSTVIARCGPGLPPRRRRSLFDGDRTNVRRTSPCGESHELTLGVALLLDGVRPVAFTSWASDPPGRSSASVMAFHSRPALAIGRGSLRLCSCRRDVFSDGLREVAYVREGQRRRRWSVSRSVEQLRRVLSDPRQRRHRQFERATRRGY